MKEELQTLPLEALYSSFRKLVRKLRRTYETYETDTDDGVSNHGLKSHRCELNAIGWQSSLTSFVPPWGMLIVVIRDTDRETCIEHDRTISVTTGNHYKNILIINICKKANTI
jgi:hypothetical protein